MLFRVARKDLIVAKCSRRVTRSQYRSGSTGNGNPFGTQHAFDADVVTLWLSPEPHPITIMPATLHNSSLLKQKAWKPLSVPRKTRSASAITLSASYSYEESSELSATNEVDSRREECSDHVNTLHQQLVPVESITESTCAGDKRLYTIAAQAASSVNWAELDLELAAAKQIGKYEGAWKQKKLPHGYARSNALNLYTCLTFRDQRHQTRWGPKGFAILAEDTLLCSIQELRLVFRIASTKIFRDIMRCIYRRKFVEGELLRTLNFQHEASTPSSVFDDKELSVKTMTFNSGRMFSKSESWCILELLQARDRSKDEQSVTRIVSSTASTISASPPPAFTRTLVSLERSSATPDNDLASSRSARQQHVPNVIINYSFEEDPGGRSTRVVMHGEYLPPDAPDAYKHVNHERRLARHLMLRLAANCHRVLLIVQRRRLGMQIVINSTRLPLDKVANVPRCACCRRSFSRCFKRSRRRLCRLCGFLVCKKCAHTQEREHCARDDSRSQIERVQVCNRCLLRVDQAQSTAITEEDLQPARVISELHPSRSRVNSTPSGNYFDKDTQLTRKTRSASLSDLLNEILADTSAGELPNAARICNASVGHTRNHLTMLKGCEEDEDAEESSGKDAELNKKRWIMTEDDFPLANADSRNYRNEFPDDPNKAFMPPCPPNERERLQLLCEQQLNELGDVPELEIICSLASKELGCAASMVTVVDKTKLHVLASNHPAVPSGASFPREQGFCAQTILDTKPLVSRHVLADVRFSAMTTFRAMGINFYCGFPLFEPGGKTVIGAVCCVDQQARDLTKSQYNVMSKLASTASRVVQRAAEQRAVRENTIDD